MTTPYRKILEEIGFISDTEGRSLVLANGDLLVEESNRQRVARVSKDKLRWEWVNGVKDGVNGQIHWCRYLPAGSYDDDWLQ